MLAGRFRTRPDGLPRSCRGPVDSVWQVVDAADLVPYQSLVHIVTGRDAADTNFLTTVGGLFHLPGMTVTAVVDMLSRDNVRDPIESTLAAVHRAVWATLRSGTDRPE